MPLSPPLRTGPISKVRSFRPGDKAKQWAELLDDLKAGKKCLVDPQLRAQYDATLTTATAGPQSSSAGSESAADDPRVVVTREPQRGAQSEPVATRQRRLALDFACSAQFQLGDTTDPHGRRQT